MKVLVRTYKNGFTLVELLVALMVSSIIFGAIASLTFAVGAAHDSSEQADRVQAQVRFTTLRIGELLRQAKLVTLSGLGDDIAVWRADDNNDGQINGSEMMYIEAGTARNSISLVEYPDAAGWVLLLSALKDGQAKSNLDTSFDARRMNAVPQCSNVQFYPATIDENTEFVSVRFDVTQGNAQRHYEISSTVRGRAGHLISGGAIVTDDD